MCRCFVFIISLLFISIAASAHAHGETMKLNAFHAYLRDAPKPNATVIGEVNMGDEIEILEKSPKWIKVRLADGKTGYLWHKLLEPIMVRPVQAGPKNNVKIDAKSALQTKVKGLKPAVGEQKHVPQNVTKAIQPVAKKTVATIMSATTQSPAAAPVIPAPTLTLENETPAQTLALPASVATNVRSPVVAPAIATPEAAPSFEAAVPGQTVTMPELVVVTESIAPATEPTMDHCEDMAEAGEIVKKDDEIGKLKQEVLKLVQEEEDLRAQIRQYKNAEAAERNGELVFLKGVGYVEMVLGNGIATFKVPLDHESIADKVFAATHSEKLVREEFVYYSAPSTAFNW
jgi:hypothetical protein